MLLIDFPSLVEGKFMDGQAPGGSVMICCQLSLDGALMPAFVWSWCFSATSIDR